MPHITILTIQHGERSSFSLIERDHCIWTNYIGCFHQSNMVPTSSSTLSQGHGVFSRNSHLQRFRTVVCLQLPAVMQQSHRRQEGSKHDLCMTYDYDYRDVPKGANPNHGTVLMCFRNFLLFIYFPSFRWVLLVELLCFVWRIEFTPIDFDCNFPFPHSSITFGSHEAGQSCVLYCHCWLNDQFI